MGYAVYRFCCRELDLWKPKAICLIKGPGSIDVSIHCGHWKELDLTNQRVFVWLGALGLFTQSNYCVGHFIVFVYLLPINSFWPSDAMLRHRCGSTWARLINCRLRAPSLYPNQYWSIIYGLSFEGNFTGNFQDIYLWHGLKNYYFEITPVFVRYQWVNAWLISPKITIQYFKIRYNYVHKGPFQISSSNVSTHICVNKLGQYCFR